MSADIGWKDLAASDPRVGQLREYLQVNNGVEGLEIVSPKDVEQAVKLFHRDGYVVVADVLNDEQIDFSRNEYFSILDEQM